MKFTKFGKALLISALSAGVVFSVTSCVQDYSVGYLYVTGTVTALGDTLFPARSLAEGLKQDVFPLSSFLIRLRVIHPILAVTFVSYSAALVFWIRSKTASMMVHNLANLLLMLFLCQLALGATNVLLLAPVWLQLGHLLTADLVWIVLVLFSARVIQPKVSTLNSLPAS